MNTPHPMTWSGSTRTCGKCNAFVPLKDAGGKKHPVLKWICKACAAERRAA